MRSLTDRQADRRRRRQRESGGEVVQVRRLAGEGYREVTLLGQVKPVRVLACARACVSARVRASVLVFARVQTVTNLCMHTCMHACV